MAKRAMMKGKAQNGVQRKQMGKPKGGGVKKRVFNQSKPKMQDARQKLIQRKRKSVVDARDVLAKMAHTQDARNKLNKLRQKRGGATGPNIKVIGRNIVQKTDRNGKISLVTNKPKPNAAISVKIKKELGLAAQQTRPNVFKKIPVHRNPQALRQAVLREIEHPAMQLRATLDPNMYKWTKPGARATASQLIGGLDRQPAVKQMRNFAVNRHIGAPRVQPPTYIDLVGMDDEEMPMVVPKQVISLHGSPRFSNIHSRLDRNPIEMETHGILAQTKTKVVVPAGHRIVVSNLQPTVTQDDVKELFEDIGQLLAARLVRPGVAEVIYKNLKDAQKAVDTYHNRQLDGQPMKCLLVNKRPLNNPTAPPLAKAEIQGLPIEVAPTSTKLVPDLSTIHKVLFQRK